MEEGLEPDAPLVMVSAAGQVKQDKRSLAFRSATKAAVSTSVAVIVAPLLVFCPVTVGLFAAGQGWILSPWIIMGLQSGFGVGVAAVAATKVWQFGSSLFKTQHRFNTYALLTVDEDNDLYPCLLMCLRTFIQNAEWVVEIEDGLVPVGELCLKTRDWRAEKVRISFTGSHVVLLCKDAQQLQARQADLLKCRSVESVHSFFKLLEWTDIKTVALIDLLRSSAQK